MNQNPSHRCPDADIAQLLGLAGTNDAELAARVVDLIRAYPSDERLHFLEGSLLAAGRDYEAAAKAMARAIELAPSFAIARFQLGFLQLTSGRPDAARATWASLRHAQGEDPLRFFVEGLDHLIRDEFDEAIRLLERGMAVNTQNAPLNHDMGLLIGEMRARQAGVGGDDGGDVSVASAAQQLLQQAALKSTRH
ncbi:MAG TPA: tetratricopeptide repeat protein [Bradyrhizobium sp.]|uniref:tetratricopeptide repeat protein n=1 Tax=Bradyrhizobium sp. TaxID=376 RepID=UPI002CD86864|nr:tetratricopeptide repeat protein [Bradyrhizobium sp.]HLZ04895.1 tetratricopeptide repeat protein [Bradyrhizobium sp.]